MKDREYVLKLFFPYDFEFHYEVFPLHLGFSAPRPLPHSSPPRILSLSLCLNTELGLPLSFKTSINLYNNSSMTGGSPSFNISCLPKDCLPCRLSLDLGSWRSSKKESREILWERFIRSERGNHSVESVGWDLCLRERFNSII